MIHKPRACNDAIGDAVEAFVSIQGEGIFVGVPMAFFRLARCNRRCPYCDTAYSWETPNCVAIKKPFSHEVVLSIQNPVSASLLVGAFMKMLGRHDLIHWACITGGEPLLQPEFCNAIAAELKAVGMRILLETQGDLYEPLKIVLPLVDAVSADAKLPSVTGEPLSWDDLKRTLSLCVSAGRTVYVKLVVTLSIEPGEVERVSKLIASISDKIPFVLQPVTPSGSVKEVPSECLLWQLACIAAQQLSDVRIIPQVHRMLKLP
ncbi:MAG: 7-carboxy-7-deazaguanine synthase QueE [Armatimonadota bacterium]|nr:7-carboxy-7-deazaguanine synthase QueE [Armatimonadota bacterium]MCX7777024.1 7-carboxy-7-deazaguanine synthase QueE [Armatimonadota bacterium]MDW8024908.1 7-carboxy-7-deazaguanine synthase QueE [Armatimonadota bacterium]